MLKKLEPVGFAYARGPAIQHVAMTLDKAAPAALSYEELAKDYRHVNTPDLTRIRRNMKLPDNEAATLWLIERAVQALGKALTIDADGLVGFAEGKSFDSLKWEDGSPFERPVNIHEKLGDPFNPMSGWAAGNIRVHVPPSQRSKEQELADEDLRESLKHNGWLPSFPAIQDERGVLLVGHRRMAFAKELGIEPALVTIAHGHGDAADAERLRLAIMSNLGPLKLSAADRKHIAEHLFDEGRGWTMQEIADLLRVTAETISQDLMNIQVSENSRRKGPGRPKGSRNKKTLAEQHKGLRRNITPEQEAKIGELIEDGFSRGEIGRQLGIAETTVQLAQQRHLGRLEERERLTQQNAPAVTPEPANDQAPAICPTCGRPMPKGEGD